MSAREHLVALIVTTVLVFVAVVDLLRSADGRCLGRCPMSTGRVVALCR